MLPEGHILPTVVLRGFAQLLQGNKKERKLEIQAGIRE
jgi:hypothetical protein